MKCIVKQIWAVNTVLSPCFGGFAQQCPTNLEQMFPTKLISLFATWKYLLAKICCHGFNKILQRNVPVFLYCTVSCIFNFVFTNIYHEYDKSIVRGTNWCMILQVANWLYYPCFEMQPFTRPRKTAHVMGQEPIKRSVGRRSGEWRRDAHA